MDKWTSDALKFLEHNQFVVVRGGEQLSKEGVATVMSESRWSSEQARGTGQERVLPASEKVKTGVVSEDINGCEGRSLRSSPLGKASALSGISPRDSVVVRFDLTFFLFFFISYCGRTTLCLAHAPHVIDESDHNIC